MNLNEKSVKFNALTEQSDVFTNLIGYKLQEPQRN